MIQSKDGVFAGEIPYTVVAEVGEEPKAEILLYHGWGSNATKQRFRAQLLAAFGYRVIVPEIAGHGARGTLEYLSAESVLDFLRVLSESITECLRLAEALFSPERPHFLVGHSLGGMIALGAVRALGRSLLGVAAMNSSINWTDPARLVQGVYSDATRAKALLASCEGRSLLASLEAANPAHWAEANIQLPVLLTNGALDQTMPQALNAEFLAAHPDWPLRQEVIPDCGHVVTDSALRAVVAFIEEACRCKEAVDNRPPL